MEENGPLLAVALGSFDVGKGLQIIKSWFSSVSETFLREDVFRMVLGNVHRLSEDTFHPLQSSTFEIGSLGLIVATSIFMVKKKSYNTYYSLVLLFKASETLQIRNSNAMLNAHSSFLTSVVRNIVLENGDLNKMNPLIEKAREKCAIYAKSGITTLPDLDVAPSDSLFLAIVLSSHFQTQMNTVIEAETQEEAFFVSSFLSHFLLPYQLEHSSLELHDTITDGLFVQVVKPQEMYIDDLMLTFKNPTTYIKLPERVVFITPNSEKQRIIYDEWVNTLTLDSMSMKRKINSIRGQHNIYLKKISAPCPWTMVTLSLITQVLKEQQAKICELQFNSIVRIALASASYINNIIGDSPLITMEQYSDMCEELKISGVDDLNMILSIAQIFDRTLNLKVVQNH